MRDAQGGQLVLRVFGCRHLGDAERSEWMQREAGTGEQARAADRTKVSLADGGQMSYNTERKPTASCIRLCC